jgi:hypothetical protein
MEKKLPSAARTAPAHTKKQANSPKKLRKVKNAPKNVICGTRLNKKTLSVLKLVFYGFYEVKVAKSPAHPSFFF